MSSKAWIWISVLMAVAWGACTAEQEAPSPKTNASEISELLLGRWRILELTEENEDHTSDMKNLSLHFKANGSLYIEEKTELERKEGRWSIFKDDDRIELRIQLSDAGRWHELNDDWYFYQYQNSIAFFQDFEEQEHSTLVIQRL
jgi:hypothetical protein